MKTEIYLSKFNGKHFHSSSTFLFVDSNGNAQLDLSKVKLRNYFKVIQLKKDALIFHERYAFEDAFEDFCKKYPQIHWSVELKVKSGFNNEFTIFSDYPFTLNQLQEKIRKFCDIPEYEFHLCEDLDYYSKLLNKELLNHKIKQAGIKVGENAVVLTNGKYLVSKYCDLRHLKFVVSPEYAEFLSFSNNTELAKEINILWENSPEFMYGNYKKSEKSTPLFYPCAKSNAKHILIKMRTEMKDVYGGNYPIHSNVYHEFNSPYIFNIIENGIKLEYEEESI